ncbi:MAG: FAD-dependent oxidoreductase [Spirochaetota bacterium]
MDEELYDIVIVGAGSAGLAAGIYGARARRTTLILDKKRPGGQAATTEKMENYPGFPESIGGKELMERFREHALKMGCNIEKAEVRGTFGEKNGLYTVFAGNNAVFKGRSLILAPGCEPRRLGIPGEKELSGRGVSYCATCDAELYEGAKVIVAGSGDTAVEEADYISRFADEVVMIVVHDEGILDCNKTMAERAMENPKLKWKWNRSLLAIEGEGTVEQVKLKNLRTGCQEDAECAGVFIFVGIIPQTAFIGDFVSMKNGFIVTDEKMETNRPLVFAAGDARVKALRQVVTAASDGAIAAFHADKALTEIDEYGKSVKRVGREYLLYFYSPFIEESLELFPYVEGKARELNLPLIKLDPFRYRKAAEKYNVPASPYLVHIENEKLKGVIKLSG